MKRVFLSLMCCLYSVCCFANTTTAVFAKYPNTYFVETGTHEGNGVQAALEAGFTQIYSVDLSPRLHNFSKMRFQNQENVHLFLGDSAKTLGQMIQNINEPITFWLDAHFGGDTSKGETMTPIIQELEWINKHPIKTHTILIDDVREFGTYNFGYESLGNVIKKIREINPDYYITYENGIVKNDVLVAYIRK